MNRQNNQTKRVFFGFKIEAPWPSSFPSGRVIEEPFRHLTIAFLGENHMEKIQKGLPSFPPFPFRIGVTGIFNEIVFLPKRLPRVVAWHIDWLYRKNAIEEFHRQIIHWAQENQLEVEEKDRPFLSHMTICRKPFVLKEWKKSFIPLPLVTKELHLYESLGHSRYESLWSKTLLAPFEEIEHTADIAFRIRGENYEELFYHGLIAIAFTFPEISPFFHKPEKLANLEDVIIEQNKLVANVDQEIGSPIKAVSFHGDAKKIEENLLEWEMIIDV